MLEGEFLLSLALVVPDISCDSQIFSINDDNFRYQTFMQQCLQPQLDYSVPDVVSAGGVYQRPKGTLREFSYWSGWQSEKQVDPLLSHSLSTSHFGIGFWLYDENSDSTELSAMIQDYGIQLSVGLGEFEVGEPRIRLDYRWHEDYSGDIVMQLDLPF